MLYCFKRLCGELAFNVAEAVYYVSLMPLKFVMVRRGHVKGKTSLSILSPTPSLLCI